MKSEAPTRGPLRLLQVEDSESDAALAVRVLAKAGYDVKAHRVEDAGGLGEALSSETWDIILADYRLPQFDAPAALAQVRASGLDIPFIVISGAIGEDVAVDMMKSGAHDYLLKGSLARLAPAVAREIREAETRHERRRQDEARVRLTRELEERHRAQQQTLRELESALAEKTVLMNEIHHRVKNNLAVICSLLSMKAGATDIPEVQQALDDSQQRVRSIALVHELLYSTNKLDRIDFADYARQVVRQLKSVFGAEWVEISVEADAAPHELEIERAVPCALILNELVTNAFKHAFPKKRPGEIRISFRDAGSGLLELAIEDDGIGCPADKAGGAGNSLGMNIVHILARQVDGALAQEECRGTRFVLRFPAASPSRGDRRSRAATDAPPR